MGFGWASLGGFGLEGAGPVSCEPSARSSGPVAVGPTLAGPGTRSKSPASLSRQRGRDLEGVFFAVSMRTCELGAKIPSYIQSWKHLALVQSGILHESRQ